MKERRAESASSVRTSASRRCGAGPRRSALSVAMMPTVMTNSSSKGLRRRVDVMNFGLERGSASPGTSGRISEGEFQVAHHRDI